MSNTISVQRSNFSREQRTYLNRYLVSARKGTLDYTTLTARFNSKFRTKCSVSKISGYIGRIIQLRNQNS